MLRTLLLSSGFWPRAADQEAVQPVAQSLASLSQGLSVQSEAFGRFCSLVAGSRGASLGGSAALLGDCPLLGCSFVVG